MTSDQDNFLKSMVEALAEWRQSWGIFAWLAMGIIIFICLWGLVLLVRWIFRGGLTRHRSLGYNNHRRNSDHSLPDDT